MAPEAYAGAAEKNFGAFALVLLIAALPFLAVLAKRLHARALRAAASRELGAGLPAGVEARRLREPASPGSLELRFPRWAAAKADGTRDLRTRDERIIRPASTIRVGRWLLTCADPLEAYRLAQRLRSLTPPGQAPNVHLTSLGQAQRVQAAAGWDIAPCSEELEKLARLQRQADAQASARDAASLQERFAGSPTDFEPFCAELMRALGWRASVTPPTNDGGFDLRLVSPSGSLALAECKLYSAGNLVGRPLVQKLRGAGDAQGAEALIFITTSSYTAEARAYAAQVGVELVDGPALVDLCDRAWGKKNVPSRVPESAAYLTDDELLAHYPADMLPRLRH